MTPDKAVEEALRVADCDRSKNWIGGRWLEDNCQWLLRALADEVCRLSGNKEGA